MALFTRLGLLPLGWARARLGDRAHRVLARLVLDVRGRLPSRTDWQIGLASGLIPFATMRQDP